VQLRAGNLAAMLRLSNVCWPKEADDCTRPTWCIAQRAHSASLPPCSGTCRMTSRLQVASQVGANENYTPLIDCLYIYLLLFFVAAHAVGHHRPPLRDGHAHPDPPAKGLHGRSTTCPPLHTYESLTQNWLGGDSSSHICVRTRRRSCCLVAAGPCRTCKFPSRIVII
jgi:hypothetical protein